MIQVLYKQSDGEQKYGWYVPELCKLIGVNESDTENNKFMKELAQYTRLEPDQVTKQIDKCVELFNDETIRTDEDKKDGKEKNEKKQIDIYNTSKKKREFYGIEITKMKNLKSGHIIQPKFDYGKQKKVPLNKDTKIPKSQVLKCQVQSGFVFIIKV